MDDLYDLSGLRSCDLMNQIKLSLLRKLYSHEKDEKINHDDVYGLRERKEVCSFKGRLQLFKPLCVLR